MFNKSPYSTLRFQEPLFQTPLKSALDIQVESAARSVIGIAESALRSTTDDEIVSKLAPDFYITPITLLLADMTMSTEYKLVHSNYHQPRPVEVGEVPNMVEGVRVTVRLPFLGDAYLWRVIPTYHRTSHPIATIEGHSGQQSGVLVWTIELPSHEPPETLKAEWNSALEDIQFNIGHQRLELGTFDGRVRQAILTALAACRARISKRDSLSAIMGIPEVAAPQLAPSRGESPPVERPKRQSRQDHYDVFISHASEDKERVVLPLATMLEASGLKVWLDKTTLTLGDSLRQAIDRGLAKSRFGIVVLSHAFFGKSWPQRELDGLISREDAGVKVILPIWHGISYQDVSEKFPLLAGRLAVSTDKGLEHVVAELLRAIRAD